jgi:hypothetical protein
MATTSPPHAAQPEYYGPNILLEEESFSWYTPSTFYPVRIGEIFESKYQVLLKLGYGSVSTAWLCRDLQYILSPQAERTASLLVTSIGHKNTLP